MEAVFEDVDALAGAADATVAHGGHTTTLLAESDEKARVAAVIADATSSARDDAATDALDRSKVAAALPAGCVLLDAAVYGTGHDDRAVSVVFQTPAGRTGRGVVPHEEVK